MPCGYCGEGKSLTTCDCVKSRRYRHHGLKGGAAKHPNPPFINAASGGGGAAAAAPGSGPGAARGGRSPKPARRSTKPPPRPQPAKGQAAAAAATGRPIHTRVAASHHNSAKDLVRTLQDEVRDKNINHNMAVEVAKADAAGPSHCYYLRSRRPALDVDHTFECQLMGHALVQTESWHPLFKQEGFIDKKVSRLGLLGKALEDVHDVQNHVHNLHMLDNGINRSKRWGARLFSSVRMLRPPSLLPLFFLPCPLPSVLPGHRTSLLGIIVVCVSREPPWQEELCLPMIRVYLRLLATSLTDFAGSVHGGADQDVRRQAGWRVRPPARDGGPLRPVLSRAP
eukprot:m.40231 g.40231  ORF g.40231 m.40231 type:complete len:339 (+) comp8052_c0_seq1:64-1080(+)